MTTELPIEVKTTIRWSDMDALGHLNNAVYFSLFEESRIALFEYIGLQSSAPRGTGPILAGTRCDFLAPVVWPETVRVRVHITRIGTTSFTMAHQVWRESDGAAVARGEGTIVLVDYDTNKPVAVEPAMRERLTELMVD